MVRRALLERSEELAADEADLSLPEPQPARSDRIASPWRGAGGRWIVWAARAVAWAVLLLIGYRGVAAIIESPASAPRSAGATTSASTGSSGAAAAATSFPVVSAEAYALEFGDAYLNFSPASAAARGRALARFVGPGAVAQLGWNGAGSQRAVDEQVAGISVTGRHTAVVTVLARLASGRLIELGVPVYAAGTAMSVSADPALLPGPAKAVQPTPSDAAADQATETVLHSQLPAFFTAYATGDRATLARFAAPGAHITGLGGEVTFGSIDNIYVPPGGSTRQISVTVTWQLPAGPGSESVRVGTTPASLQMTYGLTVVRQDGSWDVRSVGASTQPQAQGSP